MYRLFIILIFSVILILPLAMNVLARDSGNAGEESPQQDKLNLNFEKIDIRQILQLIALKGGVNIVAGPGVSADVSINLKDVTWREALDILLTTYGYGYDLVGKAIVVEPIDKLREKRKAEKELIDIQLVRTEVVTLNYLDANDVMAVIKPQLSPQGKVTILQETSLGWAFGGKESTAKKERRKTKKLRSNKLVVTDIPPYLDKIKKVIIQLDVKPRQILIQTRIIEVNKDFLRDIGFDWGTGSEGAESGEIGALNPAGADRIGGQLLGSQITPSGFSPEAGEITGAFPFNTGLSLMFQRLSGYQFQVIFHALEEDVDTNILSVPHIVTLDGREATILVGTKYPILKSEISTESSQTVTASLDYYQDIGIQLNVVPKIAQDNSIKLAVHPAITDFTETLKARGSANQIIAEYPIIQTREAETNVFINNGETIVIGGLLKDIEKGSEESIPLLGKIPILGYLFKRDTKGREKIDLLIFITAHIIEDGQRVTDILKESSKNMEKDERS